MRRTLPLLLLVVAASAAGSDFALQLPGAFHGDETIARDGEVWLALRVDDTRATLVASRVAVTAFEDPVFDGPGERSGRMVSTPDGTREAIALLHGDRLTAGDVARADAGDVELAIGEALVLQAEGLPALALRIDCGELDPPQDDRMSCVLSAFRAGMQQELHLFTALRDSDGRVWLDGRGARLNFAGDLDRDGRLDLILDLSDHENVVYPTLFLSRGAGDGALLRAEAVQQISGC